MPNDPNAPKRITTVSDEPSLAWDRLRDNLPVPMWEEDLSAVRERLQELRSAGVRDLEPHLLARPDEVARLVGLVRVVSASRAATQAVGPRFWDELPTQVVGKSGESTCLAFVRLLAALWRGATAFSADLEHVDATGKRGSYTIRLAVVPGFEETLGRVLVSLQDITERRRAEEALRVSTERFRLLASATFEGISVIDAGRILEVNEQLAAMFGVAAHEMVGRSMLDFIAPEDHERVLRRFAEHDVSPSELIGRRKDGSTFPLEVHGRLLERDGRTLRVSALRDISERKRIEDVLREAGRRKDEFLAVLSHELRNPLMPIRSALYVLEHVDPASERAARSRAIIGRQVSHVARLIDDLLDVTRISRGKIRLQLERVSFSEVASRIVEDYRASFLANGVALELRPAQEPLWIDGDTTRLAQAVGNLLSNAAKFTPRGGCVTVSLERDGEAALLRVRDSGIGISKEILARLFEPFTQAAQALDRLQGGLGLGLSLVKGLCELHGGTASVASEGAGRGSEFILRLPLAPAHAPELGAPAHAPEVAPRRVLVIEDNRDAAESLSDALEQMGHVVRVAFDGPSGLAAAREFRPDAVLCDIGLPGMSGYEVARAFRADASVRHTHLIALTGYALPEDRKQAADAGFAVFLTKPARLAEIENALVAATP